MSVANLSSFDAFKKRNEKPKTNGGRLFRYFLQRSPIYKMCSSVAVVIGLIVIIEHLLGNAATRKALRRIGDERLAAQGEATEALDERFDAADLAAARSVADNALRAALAHYEAVVAVHEVPANGGGSGSEQTERMGIARADLNDNPVVPSDDAANLGDTGGDDVQPEKPADTENASEDASDTENTKPAASFSGQEAGSPAVVKSGLRVGGPISSQPGSTNTKPTSGGNTAGPKTHSTAKEPAEAS
jgi:hypothetical protein